MKILQFFFPVVLLNLALFVFNSYATPPPAPIPQTGQTTCWDTVPIPCANTGQDGDTKAGIAWPIPRFTDNSIITPSDLTVTDHLTGLIWTKDVDPSGTEKNWQEALNYVTALNTSNYLGHNDWRLPNRNELESLTNEEQYDHLTWLNEQGFTYPPGFNDFWSGSTVALNTSRAWVVSMNYDFQAYPGNKINSYYVWPVRGQSGSFGSLSLPKTGQTECYDTTGATISCTGTGQDGETQTGIAWPIPRFTDNSITTPADLTVTDNLTGLIWTKDGNPVAGNKTWQQALDYIKTLNSSNYQGHNDWRLPNIHELESMINKEQYGAYNYINWLKEQGFSVKCDKYWSSTTCARASNTALYVDMNYNSVYSYIKTAAMAVWPVRSGPSGVFPTLSIPADITAEATGPSGTAVTYFASAADVVDGAVIPTCTPAPGSTLALGTTSVTCYATNRAGNTTSGSFNITVRDTTHPVVKVPANITAEATGPSGTAVTYTASATDVVDGAVIPTCTPASGSTFALGVTSVTCFATDMAGNSARGNFNVTVNEALQICGDLNGDGKVDTVDYGIFRNALGKKVGQSGYSKAADTDGDGNVSLKDYATWYACYLKYHK